MKAIATIATALAAVLTLTTVHAQTTPKIPPGITTPDKVETRLGPLEFKDGAPSKATLEKVYTGRQEEAHALALRSDRVR